MRIPYLVESDRLEAHLADEDIRILDCMVVIHAKRAFSVESGFDNWVQGHINVLQNPAAT